jgi:uncharacterized protein
MAKIRGKWAFLIIVILFLLLPVASAVTYPQLTGFVTDNADLIDPGYEAKIIQLAEKIERETTVEIAVVTIESLEGESREMYAVKLFEQAGIGKEGKDNGLLILLAKQEREYRFEVGYGLEGTITDSMKVNIGDRIIVPNFINEEYGKGIYESMLVIEGVLKGNEEVISKYSMQPSTDEETPWYTSLYYWCENIYLTIIFGICLIVGILLTLIPIVLIFAIFIIIYILSFTNGLRPKFKLGKGGGFGGRGSGGGGFGGGRSGGGGFGGSW